MVGVRYAWWAEAFRGWWLECWLLGETEGERDSEREGHGDVFMPAGFAAKEGRDSESLHAPS